MVEQASCLDSPDIIIAVMRYMGATEAQIAAYCLAIGYDESYDLAGYFAYTELPAIPGP